VIHASQKKQQIFERLVHEVRDLESVGRKTAQLQTLSSGCAALDALLPWGGYVPGSVIEYLRTAPACGASSLALAAAASAMQTSGGYVVIVDTRQDVYPPALLSHGIELQKVIFVRPESQADALWSIDQALRTSAVAAVVAEVERIDDRSARRLQLAAEQGQGLALLLRGAAARKQPSWAEVQWLVRGRRAPASLDPRALIPVGQHRRAASLSDHSASQHSAQHSAAMNSPASSPVRQVGNRKLHLQLARVRGGKAGATIWLEMDAVTGKLQPARKRSPTQTQVDQSERSRHEHEGTAPQVAMHLASQLAHPTDRGRRATAG
jgi:hypothetical protein